MFNKGQERVSGNTLHLLSHLSQGNDSTFIPTRERRTRLLRDAVRAHACIPLSYGLPRNRRAAVSLAFAENQMKSSREISSESQGHFIQ